MPDEPPPAEPPPGTCLTVAAKVRDFHATHPDMERPVDGPDSAYGLQTGMVLPTLGADRTPQYAHAGGIKGVASPDSFHSWYHDTASGELANSAVNVELALQALPDGSFVFASDAFFPIDGAGFGNESTVQGASRNFHFTTEIHTTFTYVGGEEFTFLGDDDVWVFVNGQLAIDLGGVHQAAESTLDFDALAGSLGLTLGGKYPLDIFHAERRTGASNFNFATTIECLESSLN